MLTTPGVWGRRLAAASPWTSGYGAARSLLAAGTLLTLLANSPEGLFRPAADASPGPQCGDVAHAGLFCLMGRDGLGAARWIAVAILVAALAGWRPRWTAIPHWWVSFSYATSATIVDGGDQVTSVLTLLLLPVALLDGRRWHWSAPETGEPATGRAELRRLVSHSALLVIRLQVAVLYFHAAVAKFGVREWADGTALHYWLNDPQFGAPGWLRPVVEPLVASSWGVSALTWGTLLVELALAFGLFLPRPAWRPLLVVGFALHGGIAVVLGLPSFALAMFGALLLHLRPPEPLRLPALPAVRLPRWRPAAVRA